jgi:hypothetical protein
LYDAKETPDVAVAGGVEEAILVAIGFGGGSARRGASSLGMRIRDSSALAIVGDGSSDALATG